ncbi:tyrosine-protein phosphatase [Streptomyces sp. SBR177]
MGDRVPRPPSRERAADLAQPEHRAPAVRPGGPRARRRPLALPRRPVRRGRPRRAVELRRALEVIAAAEGPVVFHCAAGKDRTGLLAALVLALLDVPDEDVVADFALTELATERFLADWKAAHPDREVRWNGFGRAPAVVMRLVLADLRATYGSVRDYATGHLAVDPAVLEALRERLVERAAV